MQDATTTRSAAILSPYYPYNVSNATAPFRLQTLMHPFTHRLLLNQRISNSTNAVFFTIYSSACPYAVQQPLRSPGLPPVTSSQSIDTILLTLRVHYPGTPCLHASDVTLKVGTVYWK